MSQAEDVILSVVMNKADSKKSSSHIDYCYQAGWYTCNDLTLVFRKWSVHLLVRTLTILTVVNIVFLSLSRYIPG
jgi:hypothetical protein